MKYNFGLDTSFDLGFLELVVLKTKIQLYYVTGLCDASVVQQIMRQLVQINDDEINKKKVPEIVENRIIYQQVERTQSLDEAVDQILSGLVVIFIDGIKYA